MKGALLFFWELPQNLLGVLNLGINFARRTIRHARFDRDRLMVEISPRGNAISLGYFVFWCAEDNPFVPVGPENIDHEYGHSIQSRWLGPLYLPVVGVTSMARVFYALGYKTIKGKRWGGYYDGFPENWADRLGGADISRRPAP